MKLSATVSALIISALASSSSVEARNAGSRRSLQLNDNTGSSSSSNNLVKRVSLAQMKENSNMQKKVKRQPLANAAPIAAAAGFGSIPSMNDGNMPIIGLSKRQNSFDSHNGKQGTALTSSNTVTSSNNSGSSTTTSSDSTDADAEECEEDDGDDDEDCDEDDSADADDEECEEDDSADDEECEEDDGEDDEEDCTEEDTDSSATTSSSSSDDTVAAATANANVNLKKVNNDSKASASSSSSKNNWGQTPSSSSAAASKTSSSAASKATESSSSSSADGDSFTGTATWYTQGGNAGACGTVNPDSARIIALYTSAYGNGDNCGRSVVIKNLDDGTQTTATVADMCPSCGGPEDIDLSVGAFEAIDPEYQTHGVRNIEWYFTD